MPWHEPVAKLEASERRLEGELSKIKETVEGIAVGVVEKHEASTQHLDSLQEGQKTLIDQQQTLIDQLADLKGQIIVLTDALLLAQRTVRPSRLIAFVLLGLVLGAMIFLSAMFLGDLVIKGWQPFIHAVMGP